MFTEYLFHQIWCFCVAYVNIVVTESPFFNICAIRVAYDGLGVLSHPNPH